MSTDRVNILGVEVERLKDKLIIEPILLSPELAIALKSINTGNRNLSLKNFLSLNSSIINDKYKLTGETIIISDKGIMINGQHRCDSVIKTGKSIPIIIVIGIKHENRHYLDSGVTRTCRHTFISEGLDNATLKSHISSRIYRYIHMKRDFTQSYRVNSVEILNFYYENEEDICESILYVRSAKPKTIKYSFYVGHYCVMRFLTKRLNPIKSNLFIMHAVNPNRYPSTTAYAADNLINIIQKKILYSKNMSMHSLEVSCLAWNDFVNDKQVNAYSIDTTKIRRLPELISGVDK